MSCKMSWLNIALGVIALICICLPFRYDLAIRLREWLDRMDRIDTEGYDE